MYRYRQCMDGHIKNGSYCNVLIMVTVQLLLVKLHKVVEPMIIHSFGKFRFIIILIEQQSLFLIGIPHVILSLFYLYFNKKCWKSFKSFNNQWKSLYWHYNCQTLLSEKHFSTINLMLLAIHILYVGQIHKLCYTQVCQRYKYF